jgi:hypothetical protein
MAREHLAGDGRPVTMERWDAVKNRAVKKLLAFGIGGINRTAESAGSRTHERWQRWGGVGPWCAAGKRWPNKLGEEGDCRMKMRNVFAALCIAVLVTFTASSFTPAMAARSKSTKSSVHKKKKAATHKARTIQKALNEKGYQVEVDGKMGRHTKVAIKKFQKDNGLKATGKANKATLEKLGIE